jgi:glycosyltransferase involved in cell wall biosynthesis
MLCITRRKASSRNNKKRVAIVIESLDVGGAEMDIVRNAPLINGENFEVMVITFSHPGVLAPRLMEHGISVISPVSVSDPKVSSTTGYSTGLWYKRLKMYQGISYIFSFGLAILLRCRKAIRRILLETHLKIFFRSWLIPFIRLIFFPVFLNRGELIIIRFIYRILREQKVDIAHFVLPNAYYYGIMACIFLPKCRRVMSRLSLNYYHKQFPFLGWMERNVLHRLVHVAIGNSKAILRELTSEGISEKKLALLYNGIDYRSFEITAKGKQQCRKEYELENDQFVMTSIGNLHTYKGHSDLIKACALVSKRMPIDWRLLIAGRDQEGNKAKYEDLTKSLGLEKNVKFLDYCANIVHLLGTSNLHIHPSHHEGLPNSVLEAMAMSLPVIGTNVGGLPEQIEHGITGLIVPPQDPPALAQAILLLANDADKRAQMGTEGAKRIRALFSIERSVSLYETIYRRLSFSS